MSTRSNVVIMDCGVFGMEKILNAESAENTIFYHHWDGYPENMETILKECIFGSKWDRKVIEERILNYDDDFRKESYISGDIDYLYVISIEERTLDTIKVSGTTTYFDNDGYEE